MGMENAQFVIISRSFHMLTIRQHHSLNLSGEGAVVEEAASQLRTGPSAVHRNKGLNPTHGHVLIPFPDSLLTHFK